MRWKPSATAAASASRWPRSSVCCSMPDWSASRSCSLQRRSSPATMAEKQGSNWGQTGHKVVTWNDERETGIKIMHRGRNRVQGPAPRDKQGSRSSREMREKQGSRFSPGTRDKQGSRSSAAAGRNRGAQTRDSRGTGLLIWNKGETGLKLGTAGAPGSSPGMREKQGSNWGQPRHRAPHLE